MKAELRRGSTVFDTATRDAEVRAETPGPVDTTPVVTISASDSSVTEGEDVEFTLMANPAPSSSLTVNVQVTDSGSFIDGNPQTSVTISSGAATADLTVPTDDDSADEVDGSVTARILPGTGYTPGTGTAASDSVPVEDNDEPPSPVSGDTWTATLTSVDDNNNDQSGYEYDDFGRMSDTTFELGGRTYTIEDLKSDQSDQEIELVLDGCLKESEFESLRIGSTTYTSPDYKWETDGSCDSNRERAQKFEFRNVTPNPLNHGSTYQITITFAGSPSSPDDSPQPHPGTGTTWTTTLTSGYDSEFNEYGYYEGYTGSMSDTTFEYGGLTYTVKYIIWHEPSDMIEFRMDHCLKASEFASLTIGSTTFSSPDDIRYTDAECEADDTRWQKFDFNDVTSNPMPSGGTYQVTVAFAGGVIDTPVPTVAVNIQEPFTSQSVTMTASTPSTFGTVSSHQWQEWSAGQWTNLASATLSSHAVTSSTSGVRTFRVGVTNSSGTTANSLATLIQWRPMSVTATASPENPESGDAANRTVTLTATADAPSGVIYQWQLEDAGSWTNLGASSTSETLTVSRTIRGTNKFRVQLSHPVVPTVESEPVYVTWDEFAIVSDLFNALNASTTSDTTYIRDQTTLVSCLNRAVRSARVPTPASFTTFPGILNSYTGRVKELMETTGPDGCGALASTMFSTNERVSGSTLASLKSGNSEYAAWLDTPQGRAFGDGLADPDTVKLVAYLGAYVADPGSLQTPVYDPASTSGQGTTTLTLSDLVQSAGLGCLPMDIVGQDLTLDNKLRVLNCLVFATPHGFWVAGGSTREADTLRDLIDNAAGRYAWLNEGDWECTFPAPQGPVPSCLKQFDGVGADDPLTTAPDSVELDRAWNPRNKSLTDFKFRGDIARWGCQDQSGFSASVLCRFRSKEAMAEFPYFWAVATINHKGWPVTSRDLADFSTEPSFINCTEPVVPEVRSLNVIQQGNTFTVTGELSPGCVSVGLSDVQLGAEWEFLGLPPEQPDAGPCDSSHTGVACSTFDLNYMPPGTLVTGVSAFWRPQDRAYGGTDFGGPLDDVAGTRGRRGRITFDTPVGLHRD